MTITVVCRKSKIAWLFLPCVLLLASCGKRQVTKSATVEAQQTAGKIRQGWATACRPLTITSEGMETGLPDIGVYMHLADATDTERNAFYGVPFIYDNGRYVAQKHHTVTADTLAAIYACFPYRQGLAADDSLVLAAPFGGKPVRCGNGPAYRQGDFRGNGLAQFNGATLHRMRE